MRSALGGFVMGAMVLCSATPAAAQQTPYYPLKVGSRWEYRTNDGQMKGQVTVEISKLEKIAGVECARLEMMVMGKPAGNEHVAATQDGVYRFATQGQQPKPPVRFIKFPVKADDKFNVDSEVGGVKVKGTFTTEMGEVTVPAGKFKCLIVKTDDMETAGQKIKMTAWYAQDVGMVKQTVEFAGRSLVLELEKFELGK